MVNEKHTIIIGAGAIGAATAYYLSKRESVKITIIEKESASAGVSGVAGGLVALDWNDHLEHVDKFSRVSFNLHQDLAKTLDGAKNYEFRPMDAYTANFGEKGEALDKTIQEFFDAYSVKPQDVDLDNKPVNWINPPVSMKKIGSRETTAQLTPNLYVRTLLKEAEKTGRVEVREGQGVSELLFEDSNCQGVILEDGTTIKADHVVVAMGPWSGQLPLPKGKLPIRGWRWNSLLFENEAPVGSVFHAVAYDSKAYAGDILPRPNGVVYMCGETIDGPLPPSPKEAKIPSETIEATIYQAGMVSESLKSSRILERRVGFMPMSETGQPLIGPHPAYSNLYIGTGHSAWGISQSPVTGKMLSEWISDKQVCCVPEEVANFFAPK